MMKLLIADDEPLVQIGLKSMVDWSKLGIQICSVASNGKTALDMIETFQPEIVIADIQMPILSGLDLAKECQNRYGRIPVFIILTSYEEFEYARTAISVQAIDYLIKLDLTPELLGKTIEKAKKQAFMYKEQNPSISVSNANIMLLHDRFYSKLLNNLFETREEFQEKASELNLRFDFPGYVTAQLEIESQHQGLSLMQNLKIYSSTVQMFRELIQKYMACQVVILDPRFFATIFFIDASHLADWKQHIQQALRNTIKMLYNYFSVTIYCSIGRMVTDPFTLSSSYYDAKQLTTFLNPKETLLFFDDQPDHQFLRNVFNLYVFRNDIQKAFEELNEMSLHKIFTTMNDLLLSDQRHYTQALDAATGILHLVTTLLPNGNDIASEIFKDDQDSYHSIYRQKNVVQVTAWLNTLEQGLCQAFHEWKNKHGNFLVSNIKKYINTHINERLTLQDIANEFSVSPNHLSQLFKKVAGMGITEYINIEKINVSKTLLKDGNLRIYEVADQVGFESAFYFSKVFKKITGFAPKDYREMGI